MPFRTIIPQIVFLLLATAGGAAAHEGDATAIGPTAAAITSAKTVRIFTVFPPRRTWRPQGA